MLLHTENKSLEETARYTPEKIDHETLVGLMAELDAWREMVRTCNVRHTETPEEMTEYIESLEEMGGQCNLADHSDYADLKEYFEDTVRAMCDISGSWGRAEAYDQNLRNAVIECIERGAEIIESERANEN